MSCLLRRAAVVALAGSLVLSACSGDQGDEPAAADTPAPSPSDEDPTPEPEPEPVLTERAPLTGVLIEDAEADDLAARPLLLVKVENSPAARPQAGLDEADVVVEELVEGGMTRFVAMFHSRLPDQVGPVRSARPVDAAIGSGFGSPVFAYSGARAQVQSQLRSSPMIPLEEGTPGFARVPDRRSPHDLFIRPADVLAAGIDRGAGPLVEPGWAFDDRPPRGAERCPSDAPASCQAPGDLVEVAMSHANRTGFAYDDEAGVYRRSQNGEPSLVTGEGRIGAANVVVLATEHYNGGCCDTNGAPYLDTSVVGEGTALVHRDGRRYQAGWRKTAEGEPLELLDADGDPFPLKPGPTWMLLPSSAVVAGL